MKKEMIIKTAIGLAALMLISVGIAAGGIKSPQFPLPAVRDQITHDHGNIATTVQNYGYIGGFSWAGRPSGRWPANSDHDYLAEMKFWIGGLNETDQVLVVNTADDFNPMPTLATTGTPTDIMLSTDTTRYEYDTADTVGLGIGYPAYGWQVWDTEAGLWTYNQVYSTLDSSFHAAGPVSVQESICRFADDALGTPIMGLEITQTVRQWNYKVARDIIFFTFEITNASDEDYHDLAVGLYCDFDIGGNDPSTGENGRLGDLVAFDSVLNLAWTYDEDGRDDGWGNGVQTGHMGTVILSTPGDIGMTSFNTDQWEYLPETDQGRYDMINNTDFDSSLPPTDQFYVQAVRGINLLAGETIQFDFAMVAGADSTMISAVAARAKALFDNNYVVPGPPEASAAKATAGNHSVTLTWQNTAESSLDKLTGEVDFGGYKIFRSEDRGQTWGIPKIDASSGAVGPDYIALAQFETDIFGRIEHSYFDDDNLVNGLEYWYAVVAYDTGAPDMGAIEVQENEYLSGGPDKDVHIVRVFPRADPIGYVIPQATIKHTYTGNRIAANDSVRIYVVDESAITGDNYQVSFSDADCATTWNLVNISTGDTLLADQDQFVGGHGTYPVAEGIQIAVTYDREPNDIYQSGFAIPGDTIIDALFIEQFSTSVGCDEHFRNDIEIRFTGSGSTAFEFFAWYYGDVELPVSIPFEVWNVTTNTQLSIWVVDWMGDGQYTVLDEDNLIFTNFDYDNGTFHPEAFYDAGIGDLHYDYATWWAGFDPTNFPTDGDIITVSGPRRPSPEDVFEFTSHKIDAAYAASQIDNIRVVPNPYLANARWELDVGHRKLQFVGLPEECKIRVYTLSGALIRTLDHTESGAEDWDMLSESGRGIASGVYLFHVESSVGNYTGKFAVIK